MSAIWTAVLESDDAAGSRRILFAKPCRRVIGTKGTIALFGAGRVVALAHTARVRSALIVFRTLPAPEECQSLIVGVRPHVRVLATAATRRRSDRLRAALCEVIARRPNLDALTDVFFLSLASVLSRRTPTADTVTSLLLSEEDHGLLHDRRRVQSLS